MKLLDALEAQLGKVGATLDRSGHFVNLDSPRGYVWGSNGGTSIHVDFMNCQGQTWLTVAMKDVNEQLSHGLRKVTDPARLAAIRNDLDDDTWGAPEDAPERLAV